MSDPTSTKASPAWLGTVWAVLPLVATGAFLLAGHTVPREAGMPHAPAGSPVPSVSYEYIVPATLDQPASVNEPLVRESY